MNLILLFPQDCIGSDTARLTDVRRVQHIREVLGSQVGDTLKAGLVNERMGQAQVLALTPTEVTLKLHLTEKPPVASPIELILALPRPQMLKRTLQHISALGVKRLTLLQSARVEKSYWQSLQLTDQAIREALTLGLEQSGDTLLPQVQMARRFRPFMEDDLADLVDQRQALIAHPYADQPCPFAVTCPTLLAIGPEGGFLPREVDAFAQAGFQGVSLGPRILRVETAVTYLLGRLSP